MSDHTTRGTDRRQVGRRDIDRNSHLLEQGVIAAALRWRRAQEAAAAIHSADAVSERIAAARSLTTAVDNYEQYAGPDEAGATTVEWIVMAGIAALVVVPSSVLGVGTWGRWFAVMAGLVACAVLLVRGERGRR